MPCNIENLTMRPVLLTLTSGQTLRLSPQETSRMLGDTDVANNSKLQKLKDKHIIVICEVESKPKAPLPQLKKSEEDHSSPLKKKRSES